MKNKIFKSSVFLVLLSAVAAICIFSCSAAEFVTKGDFTYYTDGVNAVVAKYHGNAENVKIPAKINSADVVSIADQVFWSKKNMKTITLPASLKAIGKAAFNECTGLTKVVLPSKLTTISESAFWYCTNLEAVYIPPSVTNIADNAFRGCKKLTAYVIPDTYAEKYAKKSDDIKLGYRYASVLKAEAKTMKLQAGSKTKINYTLSPSDVYNDKLNFKSSNTSVATVSSKGYITAKKCGTATITLSTTDGSKLTAKIKITVIPQKVTGLIQQANSPTGYKLSWNQSKGAKSYRVYKYNEKTKKWSHVKTTNELYFKASGLETGDYSYYRVVAINKSGNAIYEAPPSSRVKASVLSPGNVGKVKTSVTESTVKLTWSKAENATGYYIYKLDKNKKYQLVSKTQNLTSTVKKLKANTEYTFAVRAYLTYKGKEYKAKLYAKGISVFTNPAEVTGLCVHKDSITQTEARLLWNKLDGVSGYKIYTYNPDAKTKYKLIDTISGASATGCTVSLEEGKTYRFAIRAYVKRDGSSSFGPMSDYVTLKAPSLPKTDSQAFSGFISAVNSAKKTTDPFTIIKTTEVSGVKGKNLSQITPILNCIADTSATKLNFKNGVEEGTSLPVGYYIPPSGKQSKLSLSKLDAFSYKNSKNSYKVHLELKAESNSTGTNGQIAPIINWDMVEGEFSGLEIISYLYEGTVIDAVLINGMLDSMTASIPVQFTFSYNGKTYSVSQTITHNYIFNW